MLVPTPRLFGIQIRDLVGLGLVYLNMLQVPELQSASSPFNFEVFKTNATAFSDSYNKTQVLVSL